VHPAVAAVGLGLVGDPREAAAVPQQQRQLSLSVLRQEELTYICSTWYLPFGSTLAGTPPGVNTTSFTGWPVISMMRPPIWNEPMSRSAIGSFLACAKAGTVANASNRPVSNRRMETSKTCLLLSRSLPHLYGARYPWATVGSTTAITPPAPAPPSA
jgi:hypothetical protein